MDITPVIISKNAQLTIAQTLNSLTDFNEIIILDTGSTDNTLKIAKKYSNVKIYHSMFLGFGKCKNEAARLAKTNWILSIDTDEVLTPKLLKSIKNLNLCDGKVYRWQRCNFYKHKEIKYSGWGNEHVVRLYNKNNTSFKEKLVHEYIETTGMKVETLKGCMNHYSYHSISDFNKKRELYSDLFAIENLGKRKSSAFTAILHGAFDFFNTYFLKKGFLDGYRGLLIAVSNANVTFFKYLKLYEANIELKLKVAETILHSSNNPQPDVAVDSPRQQIIYQIITPGDENDSVEIEKFSKSLFYLHNEN